MRQLRILQVHNFYGSDAPSGENEVVQAEARMLLDGGHQLDKFYAYSDGLRRAGIAGEIAGGLMVPWNPFAARRFGIKLRECKPDIVHFHNTFPIFSQSLYFEKSLRSSGVVQSLHNYRFACANGMLERSGERCTICIDKKSAFPGIRFGCYRDSAIKTLPLALMNVVHRKLHVQERFIDVFLALTKTQAKYLVRAGVPADKLEVKPNFYDGPICSTSNHDRRFQFAYAGRLTAEKGVRLLANAWLRMGENAPTLAIIGSGALEKEMRELLSDHVAAGRVEFFGQLQRAEAIEQLGAASTLIFPSLLIEGFPLTLQEAMARRMSIVVFAGGAAAEIVEAAGAGLVVGEKSAAGLVEAVMSILNNRDESFRFANSGTDYVINELNASKNLTLLERAYERALAYAATRKRADA